MDCGGTAERRKPLSNFKMTDPVYYSENFVLCLFSLERFSVSQYILKAQKLCFTLNTQWKKKTARPIKQILNH